MVLDQVRQTCPGCAFLGHQLDESTATDHTHVRGAHQHVFRALSGLPGVDEKPHRPLALTHACEVSNVALLDMAAVTLGLDVDGLALKNDYTIRSSIACVAKVSFHHQVRFLKTGEDDFLEHKRVNLPQVTQRLGPSIRLLGQLAHDLSQTSALSDSPAMAPAHA